MSMNFGIRKRERTAQEIYGICVEDEEWAKHWG